MSDYRLYFMDSFHGHIERFEEFGAVDDAEAISLAESKRCLRSLELWCSHRKVAQFESLDLASQVLAARKAQKAVKAQVMPTDNSEDMQRENRSD